MSLAAAAALGGVLVAGGFYLGGRFNGNRTVATNDQPSVDAPSRPHKAPNPQQPVIVVTPEQRSEIDRAFALHESVAGPLSWYAADESTIQVAPARPGEKSGQPVAVVLRLLPEGGQPSESKTYMIVCRSNDPAVIELPRSAAIRSAHLHLLSTVTASGINIQYALAADASQGGPEQSAALVGRRHLGLGQVPLGQLTLNDCLVSVDASAPGQSARPGRTRGGAESKMTRHLHLYGLLTLLILLAEGRAWGHAAPPSSPSRPAARPLPKLAVAALVQEPAAQDQKNIEDLLTIELGNQPFLQLVDRQALQAVMKEHAIVLGNQMDPKGAMALGKFAGADYLLYVLVVNDNGLATRAKRWSGWSKRPPVR